MTAIFFLPLSMYEGGTKCSGRWSLPASEKRNSGGAMVNVVSNGHVGDMCYAEFVSK